MSTGFDPHGEQAVAFTFTVNALKPTIFEKNVGMVAFSLTETVFTGRQPGIVVTHAVETPSLTVTLSIWLLPPVPVPKLRAVGSGGGRVGQLLRPRQRGCVCGGLQLTLCPEGHADVDDDADDSDQDDQHEGDEDDRLAALV